VLAYAFLAEGAVEPLSGFAWPTPPEGEPGAWVDADTAPREALRGYLSGDLPYWLDDELWNIELEGAAAERPHLLLAERGRLLGQVDAWGSPLAWEFVDACARRVARGAAAGLRKEGRPEAAVSLEEAGDLEALQQATSAAADQPGPAGTLAGYAADVCFYARDSSVPARAANVASKMTAYALAGDITDETERAWQATWLADHLGLVTARVEA
jgi:hypothetical protein